MFDDFQNWGESVRGILSLMEKPDVWALFNHLPAHKICLLGDSAHASTPHQGAGAGMALEDAFILSRLMGEIQSAKEIEAVFEGFDHVRRPRAQRLVTASKEAGEIYEFEALGDDVERITENLQQRYEWIWDEELDAQLEKAQAFLKEAKRGL
jgi:salicylate hydroxylase